MKTETYEGQPVPCPLGALRQVLGAPEGPAGAVALHPLWSPASAQQNQQLRQVLQGGILSHGYVCR